MEEGINKPTDPIESTDRAITIYPTRFGGITIKRPKEGDMYGIFIEVQGKEEEISMIDGSTENALKVAKHAESIFNDHRVRNVEEAKTFIRNYITHDLHGGIAEQ